MEYYVTVLTQMTIAALLGLSVFVPMLTGQVSFGQQGFYAIGGYAAGVVTVMWGLDLVPALVFGMLLSAIAGVLVGIPVLRVRGLYLGVATLAFGEIVRNLALNLTYTKVTDDGGSVGPLGLQGFRDIRYFLDRGMRPTAVLGVLLFALVVVALGLRRLDRSRLGRVFRAIGEDEHAAAMAGINVVGTKVLAFAIGGAVAGLAGGLYAHSTTFVAPEAFGLGVGIYAVAYVLVGGTRSVAGPVLGAAFFVILGEAFRPLGSFRQFATPTLILVAMIVRPFGILSAKSTKLPAWWSRRRPDRPGEVELEEVLDRAPS
ncbi:MAG: branched-chain amino acid ABC transporter permease [Acidimicrobiia bacterium]